MRLIVSQEHKRKIVNATLEKTKHLIVTFLRSGWPSPALSSAIQHTMTLEIGEKLEADSLSIRFPLPTQLHIKKKLYAYSN